MEREDAKTLGLLVARATSPAEQHLLVALHAVKPRARLRSQWEVGERRIDVVVERDGRRLAVIVGRTGDMRSGADKARDAALTQAGWVVFRVSEQLCLTRPQHAVADVLAALMERGAKVPPPVQAKRREGPPPVGLLRALCNQLGEKPGAPT